VFAGDLLDLSLEAHRVSRRQALEETFGSHPRVRAALAGHVDRGGELWLVAGNHDADLGQPAFQRSLLDELRVSFPARSRVRVTPWFFREGSLHIEHGHLYDPDNAPAHPLHLGRTSLGVHLAEQFVAPTGAHRYMDRGGETPLKLFLSSFAWYGPRAPYVIYRYFRAAFHAMLKSGPFYRAGDEIPLGRRQADGFAASTGIPRSMVDDLCALGAVPTLQSLSDTFTRLYFDRVLATLLMGTGLTAAALTRGRAGWLRFAFGALLMGTSWAAGHNRYAAAVTDRLAGGAKKIAAVTGAKLVIFGHTHREALGEHYANTGSFAFPRDAPGRPYLLIEGDREKPRAVRRYWRGGLGATDRSS
jgi:UDP-2,3-diacylglucosamine pyrophosphatase LpxH